MKNAILFFFLNPFLGFLNAFKYYKEVWAKNAVWFFVIFYGFTMAKPEIADSFRYVKKLEALHNSESSWSAFVATLYELDERGSGSVDIYQIVVTYIVSLFTSNGDILFAIFGAVFGFFYSRNIWFLLQGVSKKSLSLTLWLLLACFISVIGFWNLGGVRMWTAAHIFFYGAFIFLMNQKKKGLFIVALSVLVHFSFILPLSFLIFYILIKPTYKILFFVFLGSFFISSLNLEIVNSAIEAYAPEFIVPRVSNYTSDDYLEVITELNANVNWYVTYYNKILNFGIVIIYCFIYFKSKTTLALSKGTINLFGFSLVLLIVGNFLEGVPSGVRYLIIAQFFALATIFLAVNQIQDIKFQRNLKWVYPVLIFFVIVSIRISLDTTTIDTVFSNPIFVTFVKLGMPIVDFIK